MAVTVTPDTPPLTDGSRRKVYANVVFDSTYPAGGEVLSPEPFGLSRIDEVVPLGPSTNGYSPGWVKSAGKLKLSRTDQIDDPQEENPTADMSAETVRVQAIGI